MKRSLPVLVFAGLIAATSASAQTQPAQSGPNNNAVNSPGQNNSASEQGHTAAHGAKQRLFVGLSSDVWAAAVDGIQSS
jgi:hypothetical protein